MTPQNTIVITGASSGIGAAAARELHRLGASVVPVGRNPQKTEAIAKELGVEPQVADFASLQSVRNLAQRLLREHPKIDVLVHNAGILSVDGRITEDGRELTLQTNYLAPFLLQHLLHDRLAESRARIVVTSSFGHWAGRIRLDDLEGERSRYSGFQSYANSKLADLLFAREIARRATGTGMTAAAFHPGFVNSNFATAAEGWWSRFGTGIMRPAMITSARGAAPLVHLATVAELKPGQYMSKSRENAPSSPQARNAILGAKLWKKTEELLGLLPG